MVHVAPIALTTVDVQLTVGAASETVTVTSAALALSTTDAVLGGKAPNQYSSLPLAMAGGPRRATGFLFGRAKGGQTVEEEQVFTPRLRHVFAETAYWAPSLETAANGRASLHFTLPDSLTTWKLHALASTVDGRIGCWSRRFKRFSRCLWMRTCRRC